MGEHSDSAARGQTFLFADLAGFTALTEVHGDELAVELVEGFCRSVRTLLPEYGAHEVKAIGDALMIRAADSANAVRLAVRVADELGGHHEFPAIRVGIHAGPAIERNSDWFGATVNLASRVSGEAGAGEVLLTAVVRQRVGEIVGIEMRPRGRARLKNVQQPVELWAAAPVGKAAANGQLEIDPVCQMSVDPGRVEHRLRHREHDLYFCSEACHEAFEDDPTTYLSRRSTGRAGQWRSY